MKRIKLTQGKYALVDDSDYEMLSRFKWHCHNSDGKRDYARGNCAGNNKKTYMHRFILNAPHNLEIDHKNGNTLDNRRCNLRLCSRRQNAMNNAVRKGIAGTPYKGVADLSNKQPRHPFLATIYTNGKQIRIGSFNTAEKAALAYNQYATRFFGDFARLNGINV